MIHKLPKKEIVTHKDMLANRIPKYYLWLSVGKPRLNISLENNRKKSLVILWSLRFGHSDQTDMCRMALANMTMCTDEFIDSNALCSQPCMLSHIS